MADKKGGEEVILNLSVTGTDQIQQAKTEVNNLGQAIDATGKKDVGTQQFKNYKQLIREATYELQKVEQQSGKNSAAFLQGAKALGELKRRAQEFTDTIKAFSPEDKFRAFAKIAQGATGTLAGVSGAMVALGFHSDKSAETMARLQGLLLFSNALNHLDDIKQGFLDFSRVIKSLFIIKQADTSASEAQTAANVAALAANQALTDSTTERIAAETALGDARVAADEISAEAEAALTEAKLAGLDADVELSGAEEAYLELAAARAAALTELTALQIAYNVALAAETEASGAASAASEVQAVATTAAAAAEGGATIASVTLGLALKAIGIGLIISAIVALVTEWDNIKKAFTDLFPALKESKTSFGEFTQVITGVGLAVLKYLKAPLDLALYSFKVLIDVITGDFKKAGEDTKAGLKAIADDLNIVANYKQGAADKAAQQAEEERKTRVQKEIEANERIIKERKALGKDVTDLEVSNQKLKNSILDKDDKDYEKKKLDGESEITVLQNAEQKKRADAAEKIRKEAAEKAAAQLKSDLDKIKKDNEDALKVIAEGSQDARDKELTDIDVKYKKEVELLEKRKEDVKDFNKEYNNLVTARKDEEARINKKYDDQIQDYLTGVNAEAISTYDKTINEINKKVDDLIKNATPEEADALETSRQSQINKQRSLKIGNSANIQANTKLIKSEDKNRPKEEDTPEEATAKINDLAKAQIDAENAAYELKKTQLIGQNDELAQLEADHQKKLTDNAEANAKARKEIATAEKDNQLKLYDAIGDAANTVSDIVGQNTIAGKALAIAAASIATYSAIAKTLEAFAGVPIPGFAIAQSIAIGIAGIASVKKIIDVKVPSSAGSSTAVAQPPVINSTVINRANVGTQDVVNAVNNNTTSTQTQQPIRAYIVNKDLQTQQAKSDYYNKQSSY